MRGLSQTACLAVALMLTFLSPAAGAPPTLIILYSFGGEGGAAPSGPCGGLLFGPNGSFYGVSSYGGKSQYGTVFQLRKTRDGWQTEILYPFGRRTADGIRPESDIAMDSGGTLYGTTSVGGAYSEGIVYAVSPPARPGGQWRETILHDFGSGSDGQVPYSGVTIGPDGTIYGMTTWGGTAGMGVVFALAPAKTPGGQRTETVLHNFTGSLDRPSSDGAWPLGDLILDQNGALYGTTVYGGSGNCPNTCGTVFKLAQTRSGWTESIVYNFQGQPNDGMNPYSGLTIDSKGTFYGTTYLGGPYNDCIGGCGTVYRLKRSNGPLTETVLHEFASNDLAAGINPRAPVTVGTGGALFGTTQNGGNQNDDCGVSCGVLFKLVPMKGAWEEKILHDFAGPKRDGQLPQAPLLISQGGSLYGTTAGGGAHSGGTVFKWKS